MGYNTYSDVPSETLEQKLISAIKKSGLVPKEEDVEKIVNIVINTLPQQNKAE